MTNVKLIVAVALIAGCAGTRNEPGDGSVPHDMLPFPDGLNVFPDLQVGDGDTSVLPDAAASPDAFAVPDAKQTTGDQGAPIGLPGAGPMQAQCGFVTPSGVLVQGFWRGNQGWSRTVPMKADGTPDWAGAGAWSGPLDITGLPGAGSMQSQCGFVTPSGVLIQGFWRGDQGWSRTVPMKGGTPDWAAAGAWSGPLAITGLPGSGSMQAQTGFVTPSGALIQGFWRGDQGWSRTVPMKADGTPDWPGAGAWSGPLLP